MIVELHFVQQQENNILIVKDKNGDKNMKVSKKNRDSFVLECSREELILLSNALNNIPQAVDEEEYTALIGATKIDTDKILDILLEVLDEE